MSRFNNKSLAWCVCNSFLLFGMVLSYEPFAYADRQCSDFSAISIPDSNPTGVVGALSTLKTLSIQDLNLSLNITHSWVGDLVVQLKHVETGTVVTLIERMGRASSGFGCSHDNLNVELDDEGAGGAIESLCGSGSTVPTSPPTFVPNNPLSAFDGQSISGTWQVIVYDQLAGDVGTLNSFCLTWNSTDIAVSGGASKLIAPAGGAFTYNFQISNNGPYDAEAVQFTNQLPAGLAITDISLSKGTLQYLPAGWPFSVYIQGTIPTLAVGEQVQLQVGVVSSSIMMNPGPTVESTLLRVTSPAGAPHEMPAYPINFDPSQHPSVVTAPVVLANDGVATVPGALTSDACEPLSAVDVSGKIVLADGLFVPLPDYTGTPPPCGIGAQMNNAMVAGAVGLIVQNVSDNAAPMFSALSPPLPGFVIPVVVVGKQMGQFLRGGGNATIQVGAPGVWETFDLMAVDTTDDDTVPQNDSKFIPGILGVDSDDDGTADALDDCPLDGAKTSPGICGCGRVDSSLDVNFNGVADCNEAAAALVPPAPKLRQIKSVVRVTMPNLSGASYVVKVATKLKGAKKASTKTYRSAKNVLSLKGIKPGSTLVVSYLFSLGGPSISTTSPSLKAKLKTK